MTNFSASSSAAQIVSAKKNRDADTCKFAGLARKSNGTAPELVAEPSEVSGHRVDVMLVEESPDRELPDDDDLEPVEVPLVPLLVCNGLTRLGSRLLCPGKCSQMMPT